MALVILLLIAFVALVFVLWLLIKAVGGLVRLAARKPYVDPDAPVSRPWKGWGA